MAEPQTRRSGATGRAKRSDEPSTSDQPRATDERITDKNGAETTMTPDESPALTLSLTQEHALEVLLEEAKQQITEQVRERTAVADGGSMVDAARNQLLGELERAQQRQARRRMQIAASQGEEVVSSAVQGAATLVRSVVPSVLLRPDETIDMTFDVADHGLLLLRRLSHEVFGAVRSTLAPSAMLVAA